MNDLLQPPQGWALPEGERLPVPPPQHRGLFFRAVSWLSRWFGRKELPNIFPVMHINRRLFWPWLWFASRLMPFGRLSPTLRERVILRVAWNCRSRYEWAQHVAMAQQVGVPLEAIYRVTRPVSEQPTAYEAALFSACDSLCAKVPISSEAWALLAQHHSQAELMELLTLVGHYEMVAGILINAAVPMEESMEQNLRLFEERLRGMLE